jgi:YHS domain-containing protein
MQKAILMWLVISLLLVVSSTAALAQCMPDNGIVNTVCPVLGGQVDKDTPYTANYNGKRIGFCCAECLEKFEENPQVYLDKLEGEKS